MGGTGSRRGATPDRTTLVSIQWANNETGVIQPINAIAAALQSKREHAAEQGGRIKLLLHLDATQAIGKLPVNVTQAGCDMLTLAAHRPLMVTATISRKAEPPRRPGHPGRDT